MSAMPPTRTRRVEPVLLPLLRERLPDVGFSSIRSRDNPPRECVLIGEPGQMATPVTQYVRLRVSVWARRADGTGDIDAAQRLAADIESYLTGLHPPRPVVTIGHESGPIRMSDENGCLMAYLVLLLTVETN
ncbi:hypothetical protein [Bifidobacterium scardovii]|uniref:Phage protein n=1 Tax=Bifidobacterium scardovii TaxID=158787 RepID=A0A087D409_9BIFI|nr:hypothetical protein [Bifidobacterium scardovii]KFI90259.1 hypothetical protein BSCA_1870 [Bifidobacterium scardovii]MDK6350056.1 hypothetical protein [Bifidobacterium scardovii]MDU8982177.1 hypothetical protein [Bifidobacterium scardovii]